MTPRRIALVALAFLLGCASSSSADVEITDLGDSVRMENSQVLVEIGTAWNGVHSPLRVTSFTDKTAASPRNLTHGRWLEMKAGFAQRFGGREFDCLPAAAYVTDIGEDYVTLRSDSWRATKGSKRIPLRTTVTYRLAGRRLSVHVRFLAKRDIVLSSRIGCYSFLPTSLFSSGECYNWNRRDARRPLAGFGKRQSIIWSNEFRPANHFRFERGERSLDIWSSDGALDESILSKPDDNSVWIFFTELIPSAYLPSASMADQVLPRGTRIARTLNFAAGPRKWSLADKVGAVASLSPFPNGYSNVMMQIVDDLPLEKGDHLWNIPSGPDDPESPIVASFIRMFEAVPGMKMTWVILFDDTQNVTQGDADNPEASPLLEVEPGATLSQFWRIHSTTLRVCNAPGEYLQWLRDLQNRTDGYFGQVELGNHSYHHQRLDDVALAEWENDPEGNVPDIKASWVEATFDKIRQDCSKIGINMPSVLRTPQFQFTESCLAGFVKYGTEVMDFIRPTRVPHVVHTSEGPLAALYWNWKPDYADLRGRLLGALRRGYHVLGYGHPQPEYFDDSEAKVERLISVFLEAGELFPNMEHMFAGDYGRFLLERESLEWLGEEYNAGTKTLTVRLRGTARLGQTLIVQIPKRRNSYRGSPTADGEPVASAELRGDKLFVVLPELGAGRHEIVVPMR